MIHEHGAALETLHRHSVPPDEGAAFLMGRWDWRAALGFVLWALLRAYAAFRPRRYIEGANVTRYYLTGRPSITGETGTPGWYLHEFHGPDPRLDAEHNHPWRHAHTRVLRGGYIEVRDGVGRVMLAGDKATLRPWDFHRVAAVRRGTWTLFHAGAKTGIGWGFLDDAGDFRRAK